MIKTVSLTKTFGPTTALENLSTTIESDSIYGLVGSNGAGTCWQASTVPPAAALKSTVSRSMKIRRANSRFSSSPMKFISSRALRWKAWQSCTPACIPSGHSSGTNSWCSVSPSTPSASYPPARRGCAAKSPSSSA